MNIISIQEVEKAIATYREAEAALAKHFGLSPVKTKAKTKTKTKTNGKATNGKTNGKTAMSSAQMEARQLQGQYLGAIRTLSQTKRSRVSAYRSKHGVKAAIAFAKQIA